ncbi:MAG: putative FtsK/SpoIIIE family protein, partial [Acidimicrobiales bacterium]|nr:putative FtsK/SpoIIIE family protein [Acidimicrobiales bacterium]
RAAPPAPRPPIATPPAPIEPAPGARFGLAALLVPVVMGGALAIVLDPLMAAFCLFSPVMLLGNWLEDRRRVRHQRRDGDTRLGRDLEELRVALAAAGRVEVARRWATRPDPAEVVRRATLPATSLWERRPGDADAGRLRVGVGDVAWSPPVRPAADRPRAVSDVLADAAGLRSAPVDVDLSPGRVIGLVGPRESLLALARSLVVQVAVHHGPADVLVAIATDPSRAADWDWAKWLPHARAGDGGRRLLASAPADVEAMLGGLLGRGSTGGPSTFLVVDADGLTEGRNAPARALLGGAGGPVAGVVVASSVDRLPAACSSIVVLDGPDGLASYREPATGVAVDELLIAGVAEAEARRAARALARLDDPDAAVDGGDLPDAASLLALLDLADPAPDALLSRWRTASHHRLAAPLARAEAGPLVLDLVTDGPHALVAGTTGSGKSELLRTLIASLAATAGPDHLTFVLIDYKGGSAFDACARLPHVVGLVTDLDEHLGRRALRCLEAELRHRERRLREAGASDVRELSSRAGPGDEPLPRLVVVIDEFATMAAELPDFVDSLVDVAQRGRSLGVHLVLATQRPTGSVSDAIRANTNVRIALRVQDVADSTDVVGTPGAAAIGRRQPGRALVRLGPGEVFPVQTALVTGATGGGRTSAVEVRPFLFGPDPAGPPAPPSPERPAGTGPSDLARLVDAAVDAHRRSGLADPRLPWPEPLPDRVVLDDLVPDGSGAPLALVDEPTEQRRSVLTWSPADGHLLLYGVAGSGTTTALATLAVSLARTRRPDEVHLFVLDFGTQALAPLAALPHVGAVVGAGERERQERLLRHLLDEIDRRRRLVARSGPTALAGRPAIVVLLDNYGGFQAAFDDVGGLEWTDALARVVADGCGLGICVVATADRSAAVANAVATLVPAKLVFRLADAYDYATFGIAARGLPTRFRPGRAIDAASGRELQVALPGRGSLVDSVAAVASSDGCPPTMGPPRIGVLPDVVALDDVVAAATCDAGAWVLPLGVGDGQLAPVGLALGPGDHALIAGPPRSGKTTTLLALAELAGRSRPEAVVSAIAPGSSALARAPGLARLAVTAGDISAVAAAVATDAAPQLVLIDDADLVDDDDGAVARLLAARRPDVHVVIAGRPDGLRGRYGHFTLEVRRSGKGLLLRPDRDVDGDLLATSLPRRGPTHHDTGRGYLVDRGECQLVQVARPTQTVVA